MLSETVRLPLWRSCAEDMLNEGIHYGQIYTVEYFEEKLRCGRDSLTFSMGISEVRQVLEYKGFYLSGQGLRGQQYVIVSPEDNRDVARGKEAKAARLLRRGERLLVNTDTSGMTPDDLRKHETALLRVQTKNTLLLRYRSVAKAVGKILQAGKETQQLTQ